MAKIKIIAHMIAIACFLIGSVILHVVVNNISNIFQFFEITINRITVFDSGLILLGIAFFIEFYMSFKPMEVR